MTEFKLNSDSFIKFIILITMTNGPLYRLRKIKNIYSNKIIKN
jgi:hypothetical protein